MITVCGANTSLVELQDVALVRPETAGARWKGIPHRDTVDAILEECDNRGWLVNDTQFALDGPKGNKTADMVGAFSLSIPGTDAPDGQSFSLGLMTSNAMKRAMRLFVGTKIFVCNNGCATGEVVLSRKHTLNFNLRDAIRPALDEYFIAAQQIKGTVERLQANILQAVEAEHLILEAGRRQMIPWSRVGALDQEYRMPTHSEHGANTSWTLLNAFTEVVKRSPVHAQLPAMNKFRDILPLGQSTITTLSVSA